MDLESLTATLRCWVAPTPRPPPPAAREALAVHLDPAARATLESLPGLELAEALLRVNFDADLLLSALRDFHSTQHDVAERLRAALGQGNVLVMARLAHKLRGTAGMLGLNGASAAAGELEDRLRQGERAAAPALIDQLEAALRPTWEALARLDEPARPPAASLALAPDRLGHVRLALKELTNLLDRRHLGARQQFRAAQAALPEAVFQPALADIEDGLRRLDFAAARAAVTRLETQLELTDAA